MIIKKIFYFSAGFRCQCGPRREMRLEERTVGYQQGENEGVCFTTDDGNRQRLDGINCEDDERGIWQDLMVRMATVEDALIDSRKSDLACLPRW